MITPCPCLDCENRTEFGYCKTTACINPMHSNLGTAQYGQGVQRNIITNADRMRSMTDEELAELIGDTIDCGVCKDMANRDICPVSTDNERDCHKYWFDWLKQEVEE